MRQPTTLTIGHSTRSLEEFLEILRNHGVEVVADVRQFPGSRRVPQFNQEPLRESLAAAGIRYVHFRELGGRRRALKDSSNLGWRHPAFRGYADYMQTPEFARALSKLASLIKKKCVVILCAEALPWRCHRSLVADALIAQGIKVYSVLSATDTREQLLTPFAQIRNGQISYPAPNAPSSGLKSKQRRSSPPRRASRPKIA